MAHPSRLPVFAPALLAILVLWPGGVFGREPEEATLGRVRMQLVAPDGSPAADTTVRLAPAGNMQGGQEEAPEVPPARTNEEGVAVLEWPVGVHRLRVEVPGVGYAVTGAVTVPAEGVGEVPLPRLAPFAHLAGHIVEGIDLGPDIRVEAIEWYAGVYPVEFDGRRFEAEVPAGNGWRVIARRGDEEVATTGDSVSVLPGEAKANLVLREAEPPATRRRPTTTQVVEAYRVQAAVKDEPPTVTWVHGTVRDEAGEPVAGASVYCVAVYHGGMRMYEKLAVFTTVDDGTYRIEGEGDLSSFSATLVAHTEGRPPALAYFRLPEPRWDPETGQRSPVPEAEVVRDLVLADEGGQLEVMVLKEDGGPAPGVAVRLNREGSGLRDLWAMETGDSELRDRIERVVDPEAMTGDDGVARFEHLVPGRYWVSAGADAHEMRWLFHSVRSGSANPQPTATSTGVAVQRGNVTRHAISLRPTAGPVRLAVTRHDNKPLAGDVAFEYGPAAGNRGGSTSIELNEEGNTAASMESPGLWRVAFDYRVPPAQSRPVRPPKYTAEAVVAASAVIDAAGHSRHELVARTVDLGRLTIRLLNADGMPARGVAWLDFFSDQSLGEYGLGSAGDDGQVTLAGIPSSRLRVRAISPDAPAPRPDEGDAGPLPDDAALHGQHFFPPAEIKAGVGEHAEVELRAVTAGYFRGAAEVPDDGAAYYGRWSLENSREYGDAALDAKAGELLAGPFADDAQVKLRLYRRGDNVGVIANAEVKAVGGEVVEVELQPAEPEKPEGEDRTSTPLIHLGVGGFSAQETDVDALAGRVTLTDGRTPAYGARLLYFPPGYPSATLGGAVDADGRIGGRTPWYAAPESDRSAVPEVGRLVALLPGTTGATVMELAEPPAEPLDLVLPPAISAAGRVLVGGRPPSAWPGEVRVLAVPIMDDPRLAGPLAVGSTPEPDGAFTLPGLTPGLTYRVQAAVDDIWLSEAVELEVVDDAVLPAIDLAIGEPAGGVVVTVLNAAGEPMSAAQVAIDRPTGPLAELAWPATFTTDGAGRALIPALEAGGHRVWLAGEPDVEAEVEPAPLGDPPAEVTLRPRVSE